MYRKKHTIPFFDEFASSVSIPIDASHIFTAKKSYDIALPKHSLSFDSTGAKKQIDFELNYPIQTVGLHSRFYRLSKNDSFNHVIVGVDE